MITSITRLYIRGKIKREIFVCENCGKTIYPKVVTNEDKILIISNRTELRGGKGNHCIQRNICEECAKKMGIIEKGSFKNEENH